MTSDMQKEADELRKEVRAWLRENLPEGWGTPEYVAPPELSREAHELGQSFLKRLYEAGYTAWRYPKEYGGVERPLWQQQIISQEIARTGTPDKPISNIIVAGPTILKSGQEWQKKRFIPPMLRGEECWIQGFSEPNAGSDLANVQCTAVRDGDEWVVNGQKVWNSEWQFADFGVLVVKTNMEAPRHRNLSYFIFDCKSPGYSMRPLREMTGREWFCEMFFDNVRIPHENLLGEVDMGWYAAMQTLVDERSGSGMVENVGTTGIRAARGVYDAIMLARKTKRYGKSLWENNAYRQRIAQIAIENSAMGSSGARTAVKIVRGVNIGHEVNIGKLFRSEADQRRATLMLELIGTPGQLMGGAHAIDDGAYPQDMLWSRAGTIYAGSAEINRNIISERILGLPR